MASFQNSDQSFFEESSGTPFSIAAPATGTTYSMTNTQRSVYFNNSGTVAALTVKLPTAPRNGDTVQLGFKSAVTSLTIEDGFGNAISGAPTSASAGNVFILRYAWTLANQVGWLHWLPA